MADLLWLRQNGLEAAVLKHAAAGKPVFGICGGYQMLGMELSDPDGVEHGGTMRGLGLLPVKTIFTKEKVRTRVSGHFQNVSGVLQGLTGVAMTGYEIHMGQTISNGEDTAPLTMIQQIQEQPCRQQDGSQSGNIYGTYIHGVFDEEAVAKGVVSALLREKGLDETAVQAVDLAAYKESQYDQLADGVRNSLDMKKIYEILEQGMDAEDAK